MGRNYIFELSVRSRDKDFCTALELILITEVLFRGVKEIKFSKIIALVKGVEDDNFSGEDDNFSGSENYLNSFYDKLNKFSIFQEFYGKGKPFKVDKKGEKIIINQSIKRKKFYILLLLLSYNGVKYKPQYVSKLFEKIVAEALKIYFTKSKVYNIGHSSRIRSAQDISNLIGDELLREFSKYTKDKGLDILCYYKIDNRKNKFIVLNQCAAGNNWEDKINDIDIEKLRSYILFSTPPIKSFGISNIFYEYKEKEEDLSYKMGLIFDRPRIYSLLNNKISISLDKEVGYVVNDRLKEFLIY